MSHFKLVRKGFVIKKVRNTVPWAYVTEDLKNEKIVGTCHEKEF